VAAKSWKEWEKPLIELEETLAKLKEAAKNADASQQVEIEAKVQDFENRRDKYLDVMYSRLGPWEKVLVARAEKRPYTLDYVASIFTDFTELEGDRRFGADHAIVGGPAMLDDRPVMIIGQQKGRNITERQYRNFGMAKPEGYRKAMRLMEMASQFRMPIITFVDTPAADPSVGSEERGISEALAASMMKLFEMEVPVVAVVIGEGGSGGALAIAVANVVYMLEHSIYSVIPPEGCAAILWRKPEMAPQAAGALKLTAQGAYEFGLIDEILPEPKGGAHRDPLEASQTIKAAIVKSLGLLDALTPEEMKLHRYDKFRAMGRFTDPSPELPLRLG
jgi:acetyl-CoA carboxylase carboxyl transferase subunit alpha